VEENDGSDSDNDTIVDACCQIKVKVEEVEEIKVITKLTMPRKLKVKISSELLIELEKCKSILN
jgi:DNA polymerase-3 subunit alpha